MSGPEGTFDAGLRAFPALPICSGAHLGHRRARVASTGRHGGAVDAWGNGLGGLLAFTTQIALTLLLAHALAHTDAMTRLLGWVARLPQSPAAAYAVVSLGSSALSLLAWSLGLAGGALLARAMAREGAARGWRLDYPLLVAAAYGGFVVWHIGYSGSAPLFMATGGQPLVDRYGLVPLGETILTPWNLAFALSLALVMAALASRLAPLEPQPFRPEAEPLQEASGARGALSQGPWLTWIFALLLGCFLWRRAVLYGAGVDLNWVNWSFRPGAGPGPISRALRRAHHAGGTNAGSRTASISVLRGHHGNHGVHGVGSARVLLCGSGSKETLGFWAFLSGGPQLFHSLGRGQWVVQGDIFRGRRAARDPAPEVIMGVAYGDQWSNLIQPFWTIPLLAIRAAAAKARYSVIMFFFSGAF